MSEVKKLKDILNMEYYLENECYCPRRNIFCRWIFLSNI